MLVFCLLPLRWLLVLRLWLELFLVLANATDVAPVNKLNASKLERMIFMH